MISIPQSNHAAGQRHWNGRPTWFERYSEFLSLQHSRWKSSRSWHHQLEQLDRRSVRAYSSKTASEEESDTDGSCDWILSFGHTTPWCTFRNGPKDSPSMLLTVSMLRQPERLHQSCRSPLQRHKLGAGAQESCEVEPSVVNEESVHDTIVIWNIVAVVALNLVHTRSQAGQANCLGDVIHGCFQYA